MYNYYPTTLRREVLVMGLFGSRKSKPLIPSGGGGYEVAGIRTQRMTVGDGDITTFQQLLSSLSSEPVECTVDVLIEQQRKNLGQGSIKRVGGIASASLRLTDGRETLCTFVQGSRPGQIFVSIEPLEWLSQFK